jgi:hypothetical protein
MVHTNGPRSKNDIIDRAQLNVAITVKYKINVIIAHIDSANDENIKSLYLKYFSPM